MLLKSFTEIKRQEDAEFEKLVVREFINNPRHSLCTRNEVQPPMCISMVVLFPWLSFSLVDLEFY